MRPGGSFVIPGAIAKPSGYVAKAVHFSGSIQGQGPTYLSNPALVATDSGFFSYSFWTNGWITMANNLSELFVVDPQNNYTNNAQYVFNTNIQQNTIQFECFDINGVISWYFVVDNPPTSGWHHYLLSFSSDLPAGSKLRACYVDDIQQVPDPSWPDLNAAFTMAFNGLQFVVGDDTFSDGPTFDLADVWFAPNVLLVQNDGTIPEVTRRKFIDGNGKPVNPINFPAGAVLFSGDHTTFPTNQGTGGVFTLTGTLTDASSSPSG